MLPERQRLRRSTALAAVAAVLAFLGAVASPAGAEKTPIPHANCGQLKAAGKTWWIGASKLSCTGARTVVSRLAPLPISKGAYPSVQRGLNCVGFARPRAKKSLGTVGIGCLNPASGALLSAANAPW